MKNEELLATVSGIDWRLSTDNAGKAVFYQLADTDTAWTNLLTRLQTANPAILVLNRKPHAPMSVPVVVADNWLELQKQLCDRFYPLPNVPLLAVTGTNGKTTTVDLVLQLAHMAGLQGVSLGTLGVRNSQGTIEEFGLTTPGYIQLRKILHTNRTADFFVMEASSHALDQERLYGLKFQAAAWTNLTQDHLDYHGTMDAYRSAKAKLVSYLAPGGKLFIPSTQSELLSSLSQHTSIAKAPLLEIAELPAIFKVRFNQENLSVAWALTKSLGVTESSISWKKLIPPPGRFHLREWSSRMAVVDFAHTADALENICQGLKESFPHMRLKVLFGCGGDRDRSKRPLMGQAVARWAQSIILTSDNPRSEDPAAIIGDIQTGILNHPHVQVMVDRPNAVRSALANLQSGEILLLAGKGHENTIQIGTQKIPYSDIDELEKFVEKQRG